MCQIFMCLKKRRTRKLPESLGEDEKNAMFFFQHARHILKAK